MSTETELKKLTVPQLKVLCKEKRVTGYSKLGKDGIIQKLLGISAPPSAPSASAPAPVPTPATTTPTAIPTPANPTQTQTSSTPPTASPHPPQANTAAESSGPSTPARVDADAQKLRPKKRKNPPAAQDPLPSSTTTSSSPIFKIPALPHRLTIPDSTAADGASTSSAPTSKKPKKAIAANKSIASTSTEIPPDAADSTIVPPAAKKRKTLPATDSVASSSDNSNAIPPITSTAPKKKKTVSAESASTSSAADTISTVTASKKMATTADADVSGTTSTIPPSTTVPKKKKKKTTPADAGPSDEPNMAASTTTAAKKKKTVPTTTTAPTLTPTSTLKTVPPPRVPSTVPATPTTGVTNPPSKRPSTAAPPSDPPPPKKQKIAPPPPAPKPPAAAKFLLLPKAVPPPTPAPTQAPLRPSVVPQAAVTLPQAQPKRFVPLVISKKPPPLPVPVASVISIAETSDIPDPKLYHLDFPLLPPPPRMRPITLPPSLAQRKRVLPRFALLLSAVDDPADLRNCVLVSLYLSASHRLRRDFAGARLAGVLTTYAQALTMTDMWPYLRQREEEVRARKQEYSASFLGRHGAIASSADNAISELLWASPDHERQIVIALRFLLTRLFFHVSVGGGKEGQGWNEGQIVDAQELVKDEVWVITVRHSASSTEPESKSKFYVLEATCEPLTAVAPAPTAGAPVLVPVRTDWSAYIASRAADSASSPRRLLDHLSWPNHEEYVLGISRLWLTRVAGEGETGKRKRVVAERYVMACVVGNSLSGRYMSATQMAQDFAGLPDGPAPAPARVTKAKVNLFLPAHHHVESLHFTASNQRPLHPALAVVQTPGRIYFILRDNGMQVGCEEDGVAEVWMGVLGCENSGVAIKSVSQ
ncbi:hypothetical protein C8R46DRAFT_1249351 [Mycena filopes]|nr:hypothetical protein C8R46DRAFT_1249351 [Mycena filopes]